MFVTIETVEFVVAAQDVCVLVALDRLTCLSPCPASPSDGSKPRFRLVGNKRKIKSAFPDCSCLIERLTSLAWVVFLFVCWIF